MTVGMLYRRLRRKMAHLRGDKRGVSLWSNRMSTAEIVPVLRGRFSEEATPNILLEINTDCNYKCPFCPQSTTTRAVRYLTRDGYALVIEKLREIEFRAKLVLSVNNEPFLHPLLLEFCELASLRLPSANIEIITNGSLIQDHHLKALGGLTNPPLITVDDYTPSHKIIDRLKNMMMNKSGLDRLKIEFKERTLDEKLSNRAGNQPGCLSPVADYRRITCTWPFTALFVNPELKAFLCCSDYQHEAIVGDLNRQSVVEIWNSDELKRVRSALLRPDRSLVELCSRCDAEWWELPRHCLPEFNQ